MIEAFQSGNGVELLRNGTVAFPRMLEAIAGAQHRVWLEMYWFDDDAVGTRFRDALVEAEARGVDVRVIYDAIGSIGVATSFFEPLAAKGRVALYNPLTVWPHQLSRLTRRDHRKLLLVDDRVAFTGGVNLAEAWLPTDASVRPWRDDAVRVEGSAVGELSRCFATVWRTVTGEVLEVVDSPAKGEADVAVLPQAVARHRRFAFRAYLDWVRGAEQRIWIANAYFIPNRRMTRALRDATLRGVDVRVIVPSVSDVEIVRHASRAVWGRLLRAGARIYEWQPSILHSKTAVVDGIWSTLGSFNLDYRSLRSNLELNVSVLDDKFAREMEASFEADLSQCLEVDRRNFMFRSLGDRVLERVAYWFRSWL